MLDGQPTRPTEVLGESLSSWDQFYKDNYAWLYSSLAQSRPHCQNIDAEIEKLFVKLLLHRPELIIDGTAETVRAELSLINPDINSWTSNTGQLDSAQLLRTYYSPN